MSDAAPTPTATGLANTPLSKKRPSRWRRRVIWLVLIVGIVTAAAVASGRRPPEVQASTVMTATPSAQYAVLTASGYVVAQRRAAVSSKASGRLLELRVREGSRVKEGELIARLDAADVSAAMLAAQAGVNQAVAGGQQAQANLRSAQIELANAESELQRSLSLQQQGFVSTQAVDAAKRRTDAARATVAAAQAGIASAQGALASAQAQMQVQQVNRNNTEIRAPFEGVVLVKNANVGDLITPFSSAAGTLGAVVTMADMGTLEVEADVSEANVGKIKREMPVEIALDALPGERFRGFVASIVPTVDRAKATVMTKVRFEKLDPRVLPEMSAKVVFLSKVPGDEDFKPVTAVNPKTVVEREGKKTVFRIAADNKLQALPVSPARTLGDALEVTGAAIKPGERLVLSPTERLRDGQTVAVAK
jgi:HlyD family secretion protein